jgi:16S rRNA (guanine527-N7)-methyltransferase
VAVDLEEGSGAEEWAPGLLALKGGDLSDEVAALRDAAPDVEVEHRPLESVLGRNGFFGEKEIVAVT